MTNYPEGADNKYAPWNQPDSEPCREIATDNFLGADSDLIRQWFAEFVQEAGYERTPSAFFGMVELHDLLRCMLIGNAKQQVEACKEIKARYLEYCRSAIDDLATELMQDA